MERKKAGRQEGKKGERKEGRREEEKRGERGKEGRTKVVFLLTTQNACYYETRSRVNTFKNFYGPTRE